MAVVLKFRKSELRPILAHAQSCTQFSPLFQHLYEEKYWLPDAPIVDDGILGKRTTHEGVDKTKVEPHLVLVKDAGIYLFSGGIPLQRANRSAKEKSQMLRLCVWAEGCGEDDDLDWIRSEIGGDDFADCVPLPILISLMEQAGEYIEIEISEDSFIVR